VALWDNYLDCDGNASDVCGRAAPLYLFLAACYAALFVLGTCLIVEAPARDVPETGARVRKYQSLGEESLGLPSGVALPEKPLPSESSPSRAGLAGRFEPQSLKELSASPLARLEACAYISTATAGVFIAGSYKAMAVRHFSDDAFLTNVGSMASFGNLSGRLFWGWSCDKVGWPTSLVAMSASQTALIVSYALVAATESEEAFTFWTAAIYFNYGKIIFVAMYAPN
jgi:hypothetical protein